MRRAGRSPIRSLGVSASGIVTAPKYLTMTPAGHLLNSYVVSHMQRGTRTPEEWQRLQRMRELRQMAREGKDIREIAKRENFDDREVARIRETAAQLPFAGRFKGLPFDEAMNVFAVCEPREQLETYGILKRKFYLADREHREWPEREQLYKELMKLYEAPLEKAGAAGPLKLFTPRTAEDVKAAYRLLFNWHLERIAAGREPDMAKFNDAKRRIAGAAASIGTSTYAAKKAVLPGMKSRYTALANAAGEAGDERDRTRYRRARMQLDKE